MIKYCIVGLGEHAKSKLIPAIKNSKNVLIAIVSSQSDLELKYKGVSIFTDLNMAVKSLEKDVIFIISSPPSSHFDILKVILQNKFNAMVEKPIFLTFEHFKRIKAIGELNQVTFYECFMHRYGLIYKEFLQNYKINKSKISLIEVVFCLPNLPEKTFRDLNNITSSVIYDIGCYPISLLNDLNITNKNIKITHIENIKNLKKERFDIDVKSENINFNIRFGIDSHYSNIVSMKMNNGETIEFNNFFYGRKKEKRIVYKNKFSERTKVIEDNNLFEVMLKNSIEYFHISQKRRNELMKRNILDLENIINQYRNYL